jgi:DNA polymerase-3 subunit epsilon
MSFLATGALGIDTETTGVDVLNDRIVTACAAYRSDSDSGWTRDWLTNVDGQEIPAGATEVHGITTEHAHANGEPVIDVAEALRELMQDAWSKGRPVVGMNVSFDLSILNAELIRAGHRELSIDGPVLDPLVLDRHVDRYRRGKRTLTALCEHYDVPLTAAAPGEARATAAGAHDATADVLGALRVLWRIGKLYPDLTKMPLDELHCLQMNAHREWATHLTEYFASQGKTDVVDADWPIRRAVVSA